jgi:hypothetical protein
LAAPSGAADHWKLVAFKRVAVAYNAHRFRNVFEMGSVSCVPSRQSIMNS